MLKPITKGVHHIGLTVSKLEESAAFFTSLPGWQIVRRNEDYPAIYVSDGNVMLSLWSVKEQPLIAFNKNRNIGLHHVALEVASEDDLHNIYKRLAAHGGSLEFSPEPLGKGPAKHMMCYDPSGIRVEFIWQGK
jgi:catechol 2,3-dioxygenase-like lactoylglutathione lyase family enzyme